MSNPLIGTKKASKRLLSDMLVWLVDNERRYCCTSIKIANAGGSAVTKEIGTVVADATLGDNAEPTGMHPAFKDAITMERVTIPAGESREVPALIRGPAIVNFDELERASDAENDATLMGRLDEMIKQGVVFIRQPAVTEVSDLDS